MKGNTALAGGLHSGSMFEVDWTVLTDPYLFSLVAYTADQLLYDWKSVAEPVEYDPQLKLSQFEKHETFIRGLNFSRNETSKF